MARYNRAGPEFRRYPWIGEKAVDSSGDRSPDYGAMPGSGLRQHSTKLPNPDISPVRFAILAGSAHEPTLLR